VSTRERASCPPAMTRGAHAAGGRSVSPHRGFDPCHEYHSRYTSMIIQVRLGEAGKDP
jgi:hypothetical protein